MQKCHPESSGGVTIFTSRGGWWLNRALSDTNLKFGTMIEYDLTNIFRNRAIADSSRIQNGGHFSVLHSKLLCSNGHLDRSRCRNTTQICVRSFTHIYIRTKVMELHKSKQFTVVHMHAIWTTTLHVLTLKVLNFWKIASYCSLKPLWSGMGEVVPARTSPTLHPPFPPTVHQLSQLAL